MYRNVLVPIAFDDDDKVDASLQAARALGEADGRVTLLHVVEHVPAYAVQYVPDDLVKATLEGIHAELDRLAAMVPGGEGVVVEGHSGRTILDYAREHANDCIIVASHRPEMQDYLLGSTAAQVVRHADCTVVVIR
ncbi:universal stress protein [Tropicimonas sp.]|uniref:universal stress protein n=1 Tax=Tropicimonas sp. TaxID=2067044 RepID=UPI003A83D055